MMTGSHTQIPGPPQTWLGWGHTIYCNADNAAITPNYTGEWTIPNWINGVRLSVCLPVCQCIYLHDSQSKPRLPPRRKNHRETSKYARKYKQMKRLSGQILSLCASFWSDTKIKPESTVISPPTSNLNGPNYRHQGVFGWIHSLHIRAHLLHNRQEMRCAVQLKRLRMKIFLALHHKNSKSCGAPRIMSSCVDWVRWSN